MNTTEPQEVEVRTLPLWKYWCETRGEQLTFQDQVDVEEMVKALGKPADSVQFSMGIMEIRRWFRRRGMNFTSRGLNSRGFVISKPEANSDEMVRMDRAAMNGIREAVILGSKTPVELLSDEDRRRHEAITQKIATRLAMISKNRAVEEVKTKAIQSNAEN